MPDKYAIFDNIAEYSADELVQFIKGGVVTYDELCDPKNNNGEFAPSKRQQVKERLESAEPEDWERAKNSNSIDVLQNYLYTYLGGQHRDEARSLIRELKVAGATKEVETIWNLVDKNEISQLRTFCEDHPESNYCQEALRRINQLKKDEYLGIDMKALSKQIKDIQTDKTIIDPESAIYEKISDYLERKKISKSDLISVLRSDYNFVSARVIYQLTDNGYIDYSDFETVGIDRAFIQHMLENKKPQRFETPTPLERIDRMSTEIYFWGIPSSGKSCAIGGILSVANNGKVARSMHKDNECQGYGYMHRLAQLFRSDGSIGTLPEGTSIYSTYEMGFNLEDDNQLMHPITCIDLAGELVRCMYKQDANEHLTTDESQALQTLTNILVDNRTSNRKMHFFVIEYGAEDREYEGLPQSAYLDSAVAYIERTGIFERDTDGIYLLISKVDKANARGEELVGTLRNHIQDKYKGFYNGLERICRTCEINGGIVEIVPFSLGKVCFQNYCQFKERYASSVVKIILTRSRGFRTGRLNNLINVFRR